MMARTQIALENEIQRRARQRASDLGVSFAEYVRRLVTRDLARPETAADVSCVFDLGVSNSSDIARNKDAMIAEAFQTAHGNLRKGRGKTAA
jgi:GH24 family phage-related lysozyme (muramidase)